MLNSNSNNNFLACQRWKRLWNKSLKNLWMAISSLGNKSFKSMVMINKRLTSSRLFGKLLLKRKRKTWMINFRKMSKNGKERLKLGRKSSDWLIKISRLRRRTEIKWIANRNLIPKTNSDQEKRDLQAVIRAQRRTRKRRIRIRKIRKRTRKRARRRNPKVKVSAKKTKKKRNPTNKRINPRNDLTHQHNFT